MAVDLCLPWQAGLHWAAVAFYVLAAWFFAVEFCFGGVERSDTIQRSVHRQAWGERLAAAGLVLHTAALALRWWAVGHGPYMTRYEVLSSDAWMAVALYLAVSRLRGGLKHTGLVVLPLSFLLMAAGLLTDPSISYLPPSLRGVWLLFHILFAKVAAGSLFIAFGAAALYLLKEVRPAWPLSGRLPPLETMDAYAHRFTSFGFIFWSVMIGAGAIWADQSWGRYWAWDPVETWSLITWLLFGAALHARRFHGLRGRAYAWLTAGCFALSLFTLFAVPFVTGSLHTEYFK